MRNLTKRFNLKRGDLTRYAFFENQAFYIYMAMYTGVVTKMASIDALEAIENGCGQPIMPRSKKEIEALFVSWGQMEDGMRAQALSAYLILQG